MRGKDQPDIRPIETLVLLFAVCGPKYTLWCQNWTVKETLKFTAPFCN